MGEENGYKIDYTDNVSFDIEFENFRKKIGIKKMFHYIYRNQLKRNLW